MIHYAVTTVIPLALALLPPALQSRSAHAFLVAIGLQESGFAARRQRLFGPARGFWQFERAGVRAILRHDHSRPLVQVVLPRIGYPETISVADLHAAVEHNDVLACVLARALLWTGPWRLPRPDEAAFAWQTYLNLWRPGRPRPETWAHHYEEAWARVDQYDRWLDQQEPLPRVVFWPTKKDGTQEGA